MKDAAQKAYGMKGEKIVQMNFAAVSYTHLDVYKRQIHAAAMAVGSVS